MQKYFPELWINSPEFFFILMNYVMKDCKAFYIAFISLKLLLSKILFSHFVEEPNYWSVEFQPRNSNSWTFLNFSILPFFLLYLCLILKDCLCLCCCKQLVPSHYVTHQFSSVAQLCPTLWDPMNHGMPGLPVHHQLPEFTQTHVHWACDAIQPSHPLTSPFLPAFSPFQHQGFSNESALHIRWPKYWSFSFNISLSSEHSGLISFRMDWLDLLAVQGTLKSLLQQHSSKASILQCSALFIVQLLHPYMTTGKTIALSRRTFVV